ncbi:MAG TPA: tetratricopeptide repeat protein [Leptolyngbyaceae cyanobacterium]
MPRGIKVSNDKIDTVKQSLRRNGFARQRDLVEKLGISKNTVNKFFTGKIIEYLNFEEICRALNLEVNEIAEFIDGEIEEPQAAPEPQPSQKSKVVLQQAIPSVPVWKGRDEILTQLQQTILSPENAPKVLAIIGQGGIGKTSLVVKLLAALGMNISNQNLAENCPYQCVMYFKTQEGTSFDDVVEFILKEGFGIQTTENFKTADEKISKIIQGFLQTRCLLVLDNLESILQPANHSLAGKAISPDWGKLLNALVYQQHQSQTILTSREVPADLADIRYPDAEPDSELVNIIPLAGVATAAGVEILQQRQLQDSLADLYWISERVDGHVFLLTQLAAIGKGKPGYLRKHPELVTKKAEPILKEQLARQTEAAQDLLRRMCVLRVGIDIRGLTFLRLYTDDREKGIRFNRAAMLGKPAKFTEAEIRETEVILKQLVDSNLVQSRYDEQQCEVFYDLHRVIIEFLQAEYKDELPNLLESVYKFYCSGKNIENLRTLEDLLPVLEAQYFALQLGNYSEAFRLVSWELEKYLRRWGHWNLLKDLYEQILPKVDEDDYPVCLRQIGRFYRDTGNWDLAEKYFQDALAIEEKEKDKKGMATCWGWLGDIERKRGNWDAAERLYRQSLELMTELGDRSGMASCWGLLGEIERKRGNWDEAERLYRQALELMKELGDRSGIASCWGLLGDIERNRGNWDAADRLYRQALELMTELGAQAGIATSIGCLGENELGRGNLETAENLLKEALAKMEELGITWHIAETNYDLAKLERKRDNLELAQQYYQTAHRLFQKLGAAKDLERIEKEWNAN